MMNENYKYLDKVISFRVTEDDYNIIKTGLTTEEMRELLISTVKDPKKLKQIKEESKQKKIKNLEDKLDKIRNE